jgi:DNA adenine methylase
MPTHELRQQFFFGIAWTAPKRTATRLLRGPLKTHGGKFYVVRDTPLLSLMPKHRIYVDHTLGGGTVPLNKPPSGRTIVVDINPGLVHFWLTLKDHSAELVRRVLATEYQREVFIEAKAASDTGTDVDRAWRFIVINRMSRGGIGRSFGWSKRLRGGRPGDENAWLTLGRGVLPKVAERIQGWEFICGDSRTLAREFDGPETLHSVDPPYMIETRTAHDTYAHELTPRGKRADRIDRDRAEHRRLLAMLKTLRGAVMLHGYRSGLYDQELRDWRRVEFDMPNHSGQGKTKERRLECVWIKLPERL